MFSASEENYLKAVYHLQTGSGKVSTNALAQKLNTKPASVTDMMKKLHTKKLLHYTPYYGFTLSAEGKKAALSIIRRHRLWEYFLAEKLSFGWEEVHEIAEELEHVRHSKLIERLDAYLGFPQFDPHGDPIPDSKGKMQHELLTSLAEMPPENLVVLIAVAGQSKVLLGELALKGIKIGSKLEIKSRSQFDQSIEVKVNRKTLLITQQLASHLMVKNV